MSAHRNKQIAAVLKYAIPHIWDGYSSHTHQHEHICFALDACAGLHGFHALTDRAKKVILERLCGYYTVSAYLWNKHNVSMNAQTVKDIQAYRIAWVKSLVEEFENKE